MKRDILEVIQMCSMSEKHNGYETIKIHFHGHEKIRPTFKVMKQ